MADPLSLLYEDPHCVAVNKPSGLLSQPSPAVPDAPSLEAMVRHHLDPDDPASVYLGTIHRLDRPVSGVIVWAKTPRAARRLGRQFERRQVRKEYWAVVAGPGVPDEGIWEDWLSPNTALGPIRVLGPDAPGARPARTGFSVGAGGIVPPGCHWLRLWPETGRTHQLRVQAAARGLPVLGDHLYGSDRPFPCGIALHARALTVHHPGLDRPITFQAPLPDHWAAAGIRLPEEGG